MIDLQYIYNFYPSQLSQNSRFEKLMLKEYLQVMILDFLSPSRFSTKLTFIGGTCLRHVYGIDRFSEDLDFDCKHLNEDDFMDMTDSAIQYLKRNGINAVARDKANTKLTAFRRNIYFPELLFELNLSGHKDERLLLKIEAQDQGVDYEPHIATINKFGFTFLMRCAPVDIICSMKISALIGRGKGRDFYDIMFLSALTKPNYDFLKEKCGIIGPEALKKALHEVAETTDLKMKSKDFVHLLINNNQANKVLLFDNIIDQLCE